MLNNRKINLEEVKEYFEIDDEYFELVKEAYERDKGYEIYNSSP